MRPPARRGVSVSDTVSNSHTMHHVIWLRAWQSICRTSLSLRDGMTSDGASRKTGAEAPKVFGPRSGGWPAGWMSGTPGCILRIPRVPSLHSLALVASPVSYAPDVRGLSVHLARNARTYVHKSRTLILSYPRDPQFNPRHFTKCRLKCNKIRKLCTSAFWQLHNFIRDDRMYNAHDA